MKVFDPCSDNECATTCTTVDLSGQTDGISIYMVSPVAGDYIVGLNMQFGGTITELTLLSNSGESAVDVKIDDVSVEFAEVPTITDEQTIWIPTALNAFSAGQDIHFILVAPSTAVGLTASIGYRRA